MANIKSFPNNQDVYIGAEEVMRWLHGRTSGVFGAGGNAAVTALGSPGMAVNVSDGIGWIANAEGNGIVWWNDVRKVSGSPLVLGIGIADAMLPRFDRVIVEWKTTNYVAYPEIKVLQGAPASSPAPPQLTNSGTLRQLSLARIYVGAGVTEITAGAITDERLDRSVCGIVTESVGIDTSVMQAQFAAMLTYLQRELSQLEAGTGVELKKFVYQNTVVGAGAWVNSGTYKDYPMRAAVPLSGVIGSMIPQVVFGVDSLSDNSFAPAAECYDGGIYIYAAEAPAGNITIPTIMCWRG